jgi:ATP-dependent Clp protease adapter protein ClpS
MNHEDAIQLISTIHDVGMGLVIILAGNAAATLISSIK